LSATRERWQAIEAKRIHAPNLIFRQSVRSVLGVCELFSKPVYSGACVCYELVACQKAHTFTTFLSDQVFPVSQSRRSLASASWLVGRIFKASMIFELEITSWKKYHPRSDVKSCTWYRQSNDFFSDPEFYGCDASLRVIWIFILCIRSKKSDEDRVKINSKMTSDMTAIDQKEVENIIFTLRDMKMIEIFTDNVISTRSNPVGNIPGSYATDRQTDRDMFVRTRPVEPDRPRKKKSSDAVQSISSDTWCQEFVDLFDDQALVAWLKSGNNQKAQARMFETYRPDPIVRFTERAFEWKKSSRKTRQASTFLETWLEKESQKDDSILRTVLTEDERYDLAMKYWGPGIEDQA
jgi:hypothetical protein